MTRFALSLVMVIGLSVAAVAQDFSNVKSGLLLGVYANPGNGGMRVSDTIPGYSAEGRLFPGDVLLRTTVDGVSVYRLRSHYETENAKIAIGPNREAAVELWRPGVGLIYAWVEFTPIGGPAAMYHSQAPCAARFKMESEKPGAKAMFQRSNMKGIHLPHAPAPKSMTMPHESVPGNHNPAALFGR